MEGPLSTEIHRRRIADELQCARLRTLEEDALARLMTDLNRKTDEKRPALDLRGARETIVEHNSIAE